jgi:glutathionylspermidine synthase
MKRRASTPRPDWPKRVESQGFLFHSTPDEYWDESACYEFTQAEIDRLEEATAELHAMCLEAVRYVIRHNLFDDFRIPPQWVPYVLASWERQEPSVYGRFDFSFGGQGDPKLLEYNADTPTSLLEAGVIQWYWLQDVHPRADQFNSIHERLIERWAELRPGIDGTLYFASVEEHLEDYLTVSYLRDTAIQAGIETAEIAVEQIGWHHSRHEFVDDPGGVWPAPPGRDGPPHRAGLEDAAEQQDHPAGAVGNVPGPPLPAAHRVRAVG